MDSPRDDMQSLPEGIEALRALVLTTMSSAMRDCGGHRAGHPTGTE